jgi:hypothetical protein
MSVHSMLKYIIMTVCQMRQNKLLIVFSYHPLKSHPCNSLDPLDLWTKSHPLLKDQSKRPKSLTGEMHQLQIVKQVVRPVLYLTQVATLWIPKTLQEMLKTSLKRTKHRSSEWSQSMHPRQILSTNLMVKHRLISISSRSKRRKMRDKR